MNNPYRSLSHSKYECKYHFNGESLWTRGYAVSTVGFNEEQRSRYIREQNGADGDGRF